MAAGAFAQSVSLSGTTPASLVYTPGTNYSGIITVALTGAAPTGGAVISLSSDNTSAATFLQNPFDSTTVFTNSGGQTSITIPSGYSSGTFAIAASDVSVITTSHVSVAYNSITDVVTLTSNPPRVYRFSLTPATVTGVANLTGTVGLIAHAPAGGVLITLSSDNAAITVPPNVTIPAGAPGASFTASSATVAAVTTAHVTASYSSNYGPGPRVVTVTVEPAPAPSVASLSLSPTTVVGGSSSTGTVTLTGPAPAGGVSVSLQSSNAVATVPASVTVPAGATSATFTVSTTTVQATAPATISASAGGVTQTATLTVNPLPPFQIIGVNNGDTLSGDMSIAVNVYSDRGLLTLGVDGVDVSSSNIILDPSQNSTGFSLETSAFPNGPHTITVRDAFGVTDTRTVTFSNILSNLNYNPMFDTTAGVTDIGNVCHITGTFSSPQSWTVSITDDSNNAVNTFSGSGTTIDVNWNGTNSAGQVMPADDYLVTITSNGVPPPAPSGTGVRRPAGTTASKTFLVNIDNYADSIILLHSETIGTGGSGGDSPAVHRAKAIQYKHFLHAELDRYVGSDFHYPILVSILSDYDFVHDPKLVGRIENKFRRPALLVYVVADGEYHDMRAESVDYISSPIIHPWFDMGGYRWYSKFTQGQQLTSKDIDVSLLTANAGYGGEFGTAGNGPLVWMDTCLSTAGGGVINANDYSFGRNPLDYQWATDFGIDSNGFGGGVYFGSVASIPRHYLTGLPGNWGFDWSYWRQNVWDFLCAGGKNFQTALNRSYDIQSFTSQPTPPDAMVWEGYGFFAF